MTTTRDSKTFQKLNRLFEPLNPLPIWDEDLVTGTWVPPVDVAETAYKISVRAKLPGMKQNDINIEFSNGILTLRGERKLDEANNGVTYHCVERNYGNFIRSFIPRTVALERITATYREGVLEVEVEVPKKEEARPKQIRIVVQ